MVACDPLAAFSLLISTGAVTPVFMAFRDREYVLNLIESATGKTVAGRDSEETIEAFGASLAAQG